MAPATPSPRRFLPGRKQPSPTQNAKPTSSGLRHQAPPAGGDGSDQSTSRANGCAPSARRPALPERGDGPGASIPHARPAAAQFAPTPRFSSGRSPPESSAATPPQNWAQALRPRHEDVRGLPREQDPGDEEMLEWEHGEAAITPAGRDPGIATATPDDLPPARKRRRPEDFPPPPESPARPIFRHATTPASEDTFARPAFLPSTRHAPEHRHSEPPPEAFSPHRRGEKFVAGGMAATLQQWVVETGQAAVQSRKAHGCLRGEEYALRIRVQSVGRGDGMCLVQGVSDAGWEGRRVLLVNGSGRRIETGSVLGIRAPIWDVVVQAETWTVAVDWKVFT